MFGASLSDVWILTVNLVASDRLSVTLNDGRWCCRVAEVGWPPKTSRALPEGLLCDLDRLDGAQLRLQLCSDLDGWPWERELLASAPRLSVMPRYVTDLEAATSGASMPTPLIATSTAGGGHLALVHAARRQQRSLILMDPEVPAAQRLALDRGVRNCWRESLLLSKALAQTLEQLGMPVLCCRLYGDGHAPAAEIEQGWRPVTVMSIDVVGSTLLLRTLGAEAYARRLQSYHERCRTVVLRFEGSIDAPRGNDGLMAYFGFPLAVEDAAARALTAAWQLSSGMADLGFQVRIGVASGQVAVSAHQAFGPEVHLAARLCAAARPGRVLVAPSTRDRVGQGFVLEHCGEDLTLKDFGTLRTVHSLGGLRSPALGDGSKSGGTSNFVGRRRELNLLRETWSAACAGRLQWCVIHGEAGVGKSRLLHEFSGELRGQGERCLHLMGQAQSSSSPFAAFVDALRQHWTIDLADDVPRLRQRLADLLQPQRRDIDDLEDLARLLVPSAGGDSSPAAGGRRRLSELLLECMQALTASGPFCMMVDDAHWLDPSSVDLLRRLHDTCAYQPMLVVLGTRPEFGSSITLCSTASMDLQGLAEDEARELARQLGAGLSERVRQRVVARAEGIPLFLEESLRVFNNRDIEAAGDVPSTLEDLLMVRLDELGSDRALAQLVSVLGREFSAAHLDALLEQDDPFVEQARQQGSLGSLLGSGLLQPLDGPLPGYRFKHALIRDTAYGSIWTHDRKRLHGVCADLIGNITPALWQERPEQLAHHLEAAGRLEQARRAWMAAAQLSATRHAHQETVDLTQRALDLHTQVPDDAERSRGAMQLHLLRASALIALHGYGSAEVEAAYRAADQAGNQLTDAKYSQRVRLGLEACYVMRGDLARAAELAQAGVAATAWEQDERLAMQSRWALANMHFHQGDWSAALAGFDDCLAHYQPDLHRRSGVQDPAIMCLGYSSWIHFELGQADEALRRIARMLALSEALQHPFSTGVALGFAASIKRLCGDIEGAWPHALEAVRICERGGFQVWLAHAWMVRGQLRSDRGDLPGGESDMDKGYALWVGGGARISCATYLVTRAELLLRQQQTRRAAESLDHAWQISEQIGERYYQAELLRLRGACAWQAGDAAGAEQTLEQALAMAERQHKPGLALRCALTLGALQASQGRWLAATQRVRTLLADLPDHVNCRDTRWATHAVACWGAGRAFEFLIHTPWEPQ